jgi:hypothetical protein
MIQCRLGVRESLRGSPIRTPDHFASWYRVLIPIWIMLTTADSYWYNSKSPYPRSILWIPQAAYIRGSGSIRHASIRS